ncbi:MAG: c-type cytochrome [Gammaproteobacteria bacterium]|nr:c-type cytochrome [Gammaproteobacteria bacterium]
MNPNFSIHSFFIVITALSLSFLLASCTPAADGSNSLSSSEKLGKALFFDTRLSSPEGQSCASCHHPERGFAHPDTKIATAEGAVKGLFGNRNSPSIAYIKYTPAFHKTIEDGDTLYIGGFFLDGREKTLQAQAIKPMLNPLEMGNKNTSELLKKVIAAGYQPAFDQLFGAASLNNEKIAMQHISQVISDYENSKELSPFNSKYDAHLAGKTQLSKQEQQGLKLFNAEDKGNCAACHPSKIDESTGFPPLFTDYTYDNLGVPSNPDNHFLNNPAIHNPEGIAYRDKGLGDFLKDEKQNGKFKVPTLRNITLTAPYMHNGVFTTLKEVVDFYNTRDTDNKWADAEISENVNTDELGDLKLSDDEVDAIVAFLKTLTDGYQTP